MGKIKVDNLPHGQYYQDTLWMAIPLLCMSVYFYGERPLAMCIVAAFVANVCDRFVALLRRRDYVKNDYSSESFAVALALLLPAAIHWYVLIFSVVICVLLGKEAFGGYGNYPFHPTAVGYVVAAVSWPNEVFSYTQVNVRLPLFIGEDISFVSSMSNTLKLGGLPIINIDDLLLGNYAGAMGTTAVLVIAACSLFFLARRDINLLAPLAFLGACAAVIILFPRQADLTGALMETMPERLNLLKYEMFSGAMCFGAVFLICEPFTCPKHWGARFIYGVLLGVAAMMFRYYGVYETGICFALIGVNSVSGWLDRISIKRMVRALAKKPSAKEVPLGETAQTSETAPVAQAAPTVENESVCENTPVSEEGGQPV